MRPVLETNSNGSKPRSRDDELAIAAADAIDFITTVPRDTIQIVVRDGWVSLSGTVEEWYQKEAVGNLVRHLPDVTGITNSITVR
jgi:osmotically-inducible protein OsmY